jgi:hypothetical protein
MAGYQPHLPNGPGAPLARSIGGYSTAAKYDTREITAPARKSFRSKFEARVDPDGELSPAERERRAEAARRAYFKWGSDPSLTRSTAWLPSLTSAGLP